MRFWDSSAIVPLLVEGPRSEAVRRLYLADPDVVVWWGTPVECASAIARLEREGLLPDAAGAFERLDAIAPSWTEVDAVEGIRAAARRLLRVHPLRAGDACQLAAALLASELRPPTLAFVTLDDRLAGAAEREGFRVVRVRHAGL